MSQSNHSPVSQALARKWRPRDFASLVGQQHVVQALSHALDTGRLHHAYLFTGTRGVGKTTIARIMAKAVNCERGMSSNPCGVCQACSEISQGRFVDLLEVDAATNTKVDEMRQLLENAMYAPTSGRYKVYVIDEVHMLSSSAFNAMLKTLEEPPGHVLFILATTDPQKIPATVLSRCLQFGLRQLAPDQISDHLGHILQTEGIASEPGALRLIAKAARGSLRDALSLTDQAIAYSAGQVTEPTVRQMLGAVDQKVVLSILQALAAGDGAALIALSNTLAAGSAPFAALLDELAAASYRLSVAAIAGHVNQDDPDEVALAQVQGQLHPQALQLIYQIATHARAELHLAPEESIGFGMALIRMLAFKPSGMGASDAPSAPLTRSSPPSKSVTAMPLAPPSVTTSLVPPAPGQDAIAASTAPAQRMSSGPVEPAQRASNSPTVSAVDRPLGPAADRPLGPAAAALAASRAMMAAKSGGVGGVGGVRGSTDGTRPFVSKPALDNTAVEKPVQERLLQERAVKDAPALDKPMTAPAIQPPWAQSEVNHSKPAPATPVAPVSRVDSRVEPANFDDSEPPWVREEPLGALPNQAQRATVSHSPADAAESLAACAEAAKTTVTPVVASTVDSAALSAGMTSATSVSADTGLESDNGHQPDNGHQSGLPTIENWPSISQQVPAKGLTRQALVQTELLSAKSEGGQILITLLTGVKAYAEASMAGRIEAALSEYFGGPVRLVMQTGQVAQTAHAVQSENRKQAMEEARASIDADPFIGQLKSLMGASVVQGSQRPLHEQGPADV